MLVNGTHLAEVKVVGVSGLEEVSSFVLSDTKLKTIENVINDGDASRQFTFEVGHNQPYPPNGALIPSATFEWTVSHNGDTIQRLSSAVDAHGRYTYSLEQPDGQSGDFLLPMSDVGQ